MVYYRWRHHWLLLLDFQLHVISCCYVGDTDWLPGGDRSLLIW